MPVADDAYRNENAIGMGVIVEPDQEDGTYSKSYANLQLGIRSDQRHDSSVNLETSFSMLEPSKKSRGSLAVASSVLNPITDKPKAAAGR